MTITENMKAVVANRYGPPEVLKLREVPRPRPKNNEVRVKVHASTVGRTDTATLRAHPFFMRLSTGLFRPKMQTLGMDFAGVVDELGDEVSAFQVGDRVFGMSSDYFGAHAEYLCMPVDGAIASVPENIPFDQAVVGEGAWYAYGTTKQLTKGMRCLIYGASGAIGTAAVQLAKANGAYVVAVVGTRHISMAEALGPDRVVNFEKEDFTAIGETFDLVLDAVGKTTWHICRPLLGKNAIYTATDMGPGWSNMLLSIWFGLTGSKKVQIPFPNDAPGFTRHLAALMARGRFHGVFDRNYPLEEITTAFRYVEEGQKTGIVVLKV